MSDETGKKADSRLDSNAPMNETSVEPEQIAAPPPVKSPRARLARRDAEQPNTQPIELPDSTNATNDATNATSITDAGPLSLDLGGARLARRDADEPNTQPIELPDSTNATNNATNATSIMDAGPLFPDDELHTFRPRWNQAQASLVDEPRHAVEQADSVAANVV